MFAEGFATRSGVFEYVMADGTVSRELRPPDEVSRADSLETLGRKPITLGHPPELVTPDNAGEYQIGTVGDSISWEQDGANGFVRITAAIHRGDGLEGIRKGAKQLSAGYYVDIDETAGEYAGERYDCVQRNIKYNHVAFVERGRAGAQVRARVDSADVSVGVMRIDLGQVPTEPKRKTMASIELNGVRFDDVEPSLATAVRVTLDSAAKTALEATAKADKLQGELDATKVALDAKDAELAKLRQSGGSLAWFNERQKLVAAAGRFDIAADEIAKLENLDLKRKIAGAWLKRDVSQASADYLAACFDRIEMELANPAPPQTSHVDAFAAQIVPATAAAAQPVAAGNGAEGRDDEAIKAEVEMNSQLQNQWIGAAE